MSSSADRAEIDRLKRFREERVAFLNEVRHGVFAHILIPNYERLISYADEMISELERSDNQI